MADQKQLEENYAPLLVPKTTIERHWGTLQNKLADVLPRAGGKYFIDPSAMDGAVGDLKCHHFPGEKAHRKRGISVPVVPLLEAEISELKYWLSLHQEWREDLTPRSKRLVYHATGLTVFFGDAASLDKLQLFRAEWAGVRTQSPGVFIFEAPGAGHPHWQFDVYESRAVEVEEERTRLEGFVRALDEIRSVEEFSESLVAELSPQTILDRTMCMQHLSRAHFASCANWSKFPWSGDLQKTRAHAQGPADVSELENWIISTVVYLAKELGR